MTLLGIVYSINLIYLFSILFISVGSIMLLKSNDFDTAEEKVFAQYFIASTIVSLP